MTHTTNSEISLSKAHCLALTIAHWCINNPVHLGQHPKPMIVLDAVIKEVPISNNLKVMIPEMPNEKTYKAIKVRANFSPVDARAKFDKKVPIPSYELIVILEDTGAAIFSWKVFSLIFKTKNYRYDEHCYFKYESMDTNVSDQMVGLRIVNFFEYLELISKIFDKDQNALHG